MPEVERQETVRQEFTMTRAADLPLSPNSSAADDDSRKGSPDTRLTAPSPEETSKSTLLETQVAQSRSKNHLSTKPVHQGDSQDVNKDPFITPAQCSSSTLSPTASSFNPFTSSSSDSSSRDAGTVAMALSTDLGISRHVKITSHAPVLPSQVNDWLEELGTNGWCNYGGRNIVPTEHQVDIYFEDIRDACALFQETNGTKKAWATTYVDPNFENREQLSENNFGSTVAGQVAVFAAASAGTIVNTTRAAADVIGNLEVYGRLFAFIKKSTCPDGSFKAIAEFCATSSAKVAASNGFKPKAISGMQVTITGQRTELLPHSTFILATQETSTGTRATPAYLNWGYGTANPNLPPMTSPETCTSSPFAMYPLLFPSTFSPTLPYLVDSFMGAGLGRGLTSPTTPESPIYHGTSTAYHKPPSPALTIKNGFSPSRSISSFGRPDHRRQHATRINRSSLQSLSSHHNHVDVNRIREGIDVRTTIMLRNIPNKVDQAMLKRIVDESSWGKYDFMYLRIDFANDCNVGYAFINFVDPLDIIDFVDARGNQRWNCFKSDKVAEISYATIQGKDCLVQKFRNSSVMLEAAHYRPKLYFTSNGPMPECAGQEEPFPDPDNQSKMKRSCENAEHVGLFTPNAGQHFRDEQRRRRSQYDRGTRLAALEEYDLETAVQQFSIVVDQNSPFNNFSQI